MLYPVCRNKTRLQIREDTKLKNFPLFCPKCTQERLIHVKQFNVSVIKEPDAIFYVGENNLCKKHIAQFIQNRRFYLMNKNAEVLIRL